MSERKRFEGDAAPMSQRDARVAASGPGPQAAAEMLCDLRADARAMLRSSSLMQAQSAELIGLMTGVLQELKSINAILVEQRDDTEHIMGQANGNTEKIVSALQDLTAELRAGRA